MSPEVCPLRLLRPWRREGQATERVSAEIRYPTLDHFSAHRSRESCLATRSGTERTPCGRIRGRCRYQHRISHQRSLKTSIKFALLNTRGLAWDRLDNRDKLQTILRAARTRQWDCCCISELHSDGPAVVYIEEFVLILVARTGILLSDAAKRAWQAAGSQRWDEDGRLMAITLQCEETLVSVVSGYAPVSGASERSPFFQAASRLRERLPKGAAQIWGADWNGHVGRDGEDTRFGMTQPTTSGGKEQRRWLRSVPGLVCLDAHRNFKSRGTWRHRNGSWYELDYWCVDKRLLTAFQAVRTVAVGITDHMAKETVFHVKKTASHEWKTKHVARPERQGKLRTELMRGPSDMAVANRAEYKRVVERKQLEHSAEPSTGPSWKRLASLLVNAAEEVVGRGKVNDIGSPYTAEHKQELVSLQARIDEQWEVVRKHQGTTQEPTARTVHKELIRQYRRRKRQCRTAWVKHKIVELTTAIEMHDLGRFYKILPQLGVNMFGKSRVGEEPFTLEEIREHMKKIASDGLTVTEEVLQRLPPPRPTDSRLAVTPERKEVVKTLGTMRESASGEDEVTVLMVTAGGEWVTDQVVELVQDLWCKPPSSWETEVKRAVGILLFKKGSRQSLDNYRVIVLIALVARILGKIIAVRLRNYAESNGILPEFQWGFRPYRNTSGPILLLRILLDLAASAGVDRATWDAVVVLFFDIKKAYPRTPREAAYAVFRNEGIPEKIIDMFRGLHDMSEYVIRTREGTSESYTLPIGFREGDPSSPVGFNIYHSCPVRNFNKKMADKYETPGLRVGTAEGKPMNRDTRKPPRSNASVHGSDAANLIFEVLTSLFADDTSVVTRESRRREMEEEVVRTFAEWGETIHTGKTERLRVGGGPKELYAKEAPEEDKLAAAVRFLGAWLEEDGGQQVDTAKRLEAAKKLWYKMWRQMPRFGIALRVQAKLIKATVVASLLYGSECRGFTPKQEQRYQKFLNDITFGLCKQRRIKMHDEQKTLADLRASLDLETIRVMIGKRQLGFLGHVARMPPERLERRALWMWLDTEVNRPTKIRKGVPDTRRCLWRRIEELMALTDITNSDWSWQWVQVAKEDHGARWKKLVREWADWEKAKDVDKVWARKHAPGGLAERRAERRAENSTAAAGARTIDDLHVECPHCLDIFPTTSIKYHAGYCITQDDAQRERRKGERARHRRTARAAQVRAEGIKAAAMQANQVKLPASPSNGAKTRIRGKSAPPGWYMRQPSTTPEPAAASSSSSAEPVKNTYCYTGIAARMRVRHKSVPSGGYSAEAQSSRASVASLNQERVAKRRVTKARAASERPPPDPEAVARGCNGACKSCRQCARCRDAKDCFGSCYNCSRCTKCKTVLKPREYKVGRRCTSTGDLPRWFDWPADVPKTRCPWCNTLEYGVKTPLHALTCKKMPYDLWLKGVRLLPRGGGQGQFPCAQCGTRYDTAKAAAVHGRYCEERRTVEGLLLHSGQYHIIAEL